MATAAAPPPPAPTQVPQREPKIVFIGPTGSGKSTMINDLLGLRSDAEPTYANGQTRPSPVGLSTPLVVRGQLDNGAPCTCIDTHGLNDTGNNDSLNIVNMVRTLKEQVREVHTFVIVLNGQNPRLDQAHKDMISIFGKCFGSDFMQNMVLAFTRWYEDDASRERRADEIAMCSNGFQGTPEQYCQREFTEVFREAFHYTGVMRMIFGDFKLRPTATRVEKEQNAKARNFLSLFALTMDPFSCQNIEAHKTKLDEARGKLDEVQQKNDEMSAQTEAQKHMHAEEMETIRKLMDDTNANNATKMKRLENKLHDAEKRAADASKNDGARST